MKRPRILSAAFVRTVNQPGRYGDGRGGYGLSLLVKPRSNGRLSKTWSQRVRLHGRVTNIGLGAYPIVSLSEARKKALANRRTIEKGLDPRGSRIPTFSQAAEKVIAMHAAGWKPGGKSEGQWRSSLSTYVYPRLGDVAVDRVSTADVMACLVPIWHTRPETARRIRQRIGAVMRWAIAQGYRADNPAGDAITAALPSNTGRRRHHRALPHADVAASITTIRASAAYPTTVLAFEFLVLTACRSGEVRGALWDEINLDAATWTIPDSRMKSARPHRVPLPEEALDLLAEAERFRDRSGLVFPSPTGRELSDTTLSKLLRENGIPAVPHGYRSSFRDWAAELTDTPREICELALAHVNSDRVEAAYRRSDLFDHRRQLMQRWANYLHTQTPTATPPPT
ncbi:tyrosine-type recombinase/integrase [Candidatus Spongiisocius sp.]|uniref:tyrosine-type recombinase/integrase n=1 Tax=Candidatus Spongiisocius sp. TaxID=3101273 RepID=UPI003B5B16E5